MLGQTGDQLFSLIAPREAVESFPCISRSELENTVHLFQASNLPNVYLCLSEVQFIKRTALCRVSREA